VLAKNTPSTLEIWLKSAESLSGFTTKFLRRRLKFELE